VTALILGFSDKKIAFNFVILMSTRAKYTLVRGQPETPEAKLDTDILMRFSPKYGTFPLTQASTSPARSPSSSVRASPR
jgi:hypothetical protein